MAMPAAGDDLLARTRELASSAMAAVDSVIFHVSGEAVAEDAVVTRSERHSVQLIAVAQALHALDTPHVREVVVVTHGARLLPQDPPMSLAGLAASAVVGLVRTIASENPDVRIRQVDCPRDELAGVARLVAEAGRE
jgi:hypothetical protein